MRERRREKERWKRYDKAADEYVDIVKNLARPLPSHSALLHTLFITAECILETRKISELRAHTHSSSCAVPCLLYIKPIYVLQLFSETTYVIKI